MTAIRKLLVANRGEIARRVFRTCREMGISSVAVFSEADRDALFVHEADEAVPLGGLTPAESYLRGSVLVEAALRTKADAVHPGYGFLAEDAAFARLCQDAGLLFVGPTPEAIATMGNKVTAKVLVREVGVPVLPGAVLAGLGASERKTVATGIGWPVLVKAAAGGGGRGMRIVRGPEDLGDAVASARREAKAAFGDDAVFLERYLEDARHVEVQVMGDAHGHIVSLFERECSIQRRHQKVLEESPSVAVDEGLRAALGSAAVAAARAVGYVGAGTVEFLLTREREFFFLEMNTRLQVEHPVTECLTGLDLVRLQIHVAEGDALPYEVVAATRRGHAIEARLCAEDPERGFLPATGTLERFHIPAGPGIRIDAGVADGSAVSPHYDSLLAKVIAHAPTRAQAISRLVGALSGARLHGVATNRDLLLGLLRHPDFVEGRTDTHFLERVPALELSNPLPLEARRLHAAAAALALAAERRRTAPILGSLPSGWRNNPSQLQEAAFEDPGGRIDVAYAWRADGLVVRVGPHDFVRPRVSVLRPDIVDLEADGVRRRYEVHRVGDVHYVDSALGHSALREAERFPRAPAPKVEGALRSPLPGRVARVRATVGEEVTAGSLLVVIEAMKMEHQVRAPRSARVASVHVAEGQQVEAGAALVALED